NFDKRVKRLEKRSSSLITHQVPNPDRVHQRKLRSTTETFPPHVPTKELKPLPSHLKYAYLDDNQQLLVIIANNLHQEQEEKLLQVIRHHKKAMVEIMRPSKNKPLHLHA
ncbi:hypothetical protein CR513_21259, partial [Mucuna pruriens]